jgi:hypothetical protein
MPLPQSIGVCGQCNRISRPDEGRGSQSLRFSAYVARPAAKSAPAIVVHPAAKRDQAGVTLILGRGAGAGSDKRFHGDLFHCVGSASSI